MKYFTSEPIGLYNAENNEIPEKAIAITDELYTQLINGQANGKFIQANSNCEPILVDELKLSHQQYIELAEIKKSRLIQYAMSAISFLQTKLQLNRITDDEKNQLNLWIDYIDAINAVDTSTAPDIKWPTPPDELAK
ncbi:MAG: tail fiber assembly protein [Plesiomonas sp.]|uniref:tail fiber assembly protein n=1 Tax=Plesiomonas sp. TaxID=2486279 RepID=UPI003F38BB63